MKNSYSLYLPNPASLRQGGTQHEDTGAVQPRWAQWQGHTHR